MSVNQRFELRGFDVRARLLVEQDADKLGVAVYVQLEVKDRETGLDNGVTMRHLHSERAWRSMSPDLRARLVFDMCREALRHELEECYYVDGERVYDPHKAEAP